MVLHIGGPEPKLVAANLGDSRAIVAQRPDGNPSSDMDGVTAAYELTADQKPDDPQERARIQVRRYSTVTRGAHRGAPLLDRYTRRASRCAARVTVGNASSSARNARVHSAACGRQYSHRAPMAVSYGFVGFVARKIAARSRRLQPFHSLQDAGGFVAMKSDDGEPARVFTSILMNGCGLAVARSIGDHEFSAVGVTAEPVLSTMQVSTVRQRRSTSTRLEMGT